MALLQAEVVVCPSERDERVLAFMKAGRLRSVRTKLAADAVVIEQVDRPALLEEVRRV